MNLKMSLQMIEAEYAKELSTMLDELGECGLCKKSPTIPVQLFVEKGYYCLCCIRKYLELNTRTKGIVSSPQGQYIDTRLSAFDIYEDYDKLIELDLVLDILSTEILCSCGLIFRRHIELRHHLRTTYGSHKQ